MSLSDAMPAGGQSVAPSKRPGGIRPVWLRPVALSLVLLAHGAMFLVVRRQPAPLTPLDAVEVTLEPLGNAPEDQQKVEEVKPTEAPPPPPSLPMEQAELTAPPPQVVAPEAIPLPVEKPRPKVIVKPKPKPKPVVEEEDDRPTPAELRAEARKRELDAERRRKAQEARAEARRGVAEGGQSSGMSRGAYAGILAAELRRHQFYPASARADGVTGSVGVAFTVGASGRVVSQSITRSSGNSALDGTARAMMNAVHTPPPPGGSFSTSTTIRFNLN